MREGMCWRHVLLQGHMAGVASFDVHMYLHMLGMLRGNPASALRDPAFGSNALVHCKLLRWQDCCEGRQVSEPALCAAFKRSP